MIQLSSLMWAAAIFFAVIGFLRGWNRELIATAGIILATFALFQFDGLLRGSLFLLARVDDVFLFQAIVFSVVVFIAYQSRAIGERRGARSWQTGLLGALVGFLNGYLIGGAIWYLLDINEYPLAPLVTAPGPGSPSAQSITMMPMVLLSGGLSGSGDSITIAVIVVLMIVVLVAF